MYFLLLRWMTWVNWHVRSLAFPVYSSSTALVHHQRQAGRLCEWPPEAESATSQVVHASEPNSSRRKNFSAHLDGVLRCDTRSNTRAATWCLVFICQRSISLLRRIVYWLQRAVRTGKGPCGRSTLSYLWLTKSRVFSQRTPYIQWAGTNM